MCLLRASCTRTTKKKVLEGGGVRARVSRFQGAICCPSPSGSFFFSYPIFAPRRRASCTRAATVLTLSIPPGRLGWLSKGWLECVPVFSARRQRVGGRRAYRNQPRKRKKERIRPQLPCSTASSPLFSFSHMLTRELQHTQDQLPSTHTHDTRPCAFTATTIVPQIRNNVYSV